MDRQRFEKRPEKVGRDKMARDDFCGTYTTVEITIRRREKLAGQTLAVKVKYQRSENAKPGTLHEQTCTRKCREEQTSDDEK